MKCPPQLLEMGHANADERIPTWGSIGALLFSLCPPALSSYFEHYPRVLKDKVCRVWGESTANNAPETALRDASACFLRSIRIDLKSDSALIPSVTMLFAGYAVSRFARAFAERRYRLPEILWEFRRSTHHLNHFIRLHLVLVSQPPTCTAAAATGTANGLVLLSSSSSSSSSFAGGSESNSSLTDAKERADPEGCGMPDVHMSIISGNGLHSMRAAETAKEGDEEGDESLEARQSDREGFGSSQKTREKSLALSPPQEEKIEEADVALSQWCIAVWSLKPIVKRIALVEDMRQIEGLGHLERSLRSNVTYIPISFDTTLYNPHLNDEHGQGATQFMTVFVNSSYSSYMSMRRLGFWEDRSLRPLMVDAWTALVSMLHELLRAAIVADSKTQKRGGDGMDVSNENGGGLCGASGSQRLHSTRKKTHSMASSSSSNSNSTEESSTNSSLSLCESTTYQLSTIIVVPDHILTRAVGMCDVLMSSSYSLWSLDGARAEYGGEEVQPHSSEDGLLVVEDKAIQEYLIPSLIKGSSRKYKLLSPFIDEPLVREARALLAPSLKVALANTIYGALLTLRRLTLHLPCLGDSVVSSKKRTLDDSREYRNNDTTDGMGARSNVKLSASSSASSSPYHLAAPPFTIVDYARLKLSGWGTVFTAWRVMASFVSWGPLMCWLGFCLAASGTALAERFFNKYIAASFSGGGGSSQQMYSPLNSNSLIGSDVQIMSLCDEALRKFVLSSGTSSGSISASGSAAVLSDVGGDSSARGGHSLGLFFASAVFSAFISVLEVICTDLEEYNEEIVKQRLMRSAETRTTLMCCAQNTHTIVGGGGGHGGGFVSRQFERLGRIESITSLMYYSISSTMRLGEVALVFVDLPAAMVCATLATYGVVRIVFSARRNFARVKVARHHFSAGGKAEAVMKAKQIRTFTNYVLSGARSLVPLGRRRRGAIKRRQLKKDGSQIANDENVASSYSEEAEAFLVLEESDADDGESSSSSRDSNDREDDPSRSRPHPSRSLISSPSLAMLMLQQRLGALRGTPSAQQSSSGGASSIFGGIDIGTFSFLRQSHANPCTGVQGDRYWSLLQCEEEGRGGGVGGGVAVASAVAARDRRPCFGLVLLLSVAAESRKSSPPFSSPVVASHCPRPPSQSSFLLKGVAPYPNLWLPVASFYLSSAFTPLDSKELGQGLRAAERWCEAASDVLSVVVALTTTATHKQQNTNGRHAQKTTPLLLLATARGVNDLKDKARMLRESLSYSSGTGMATIDDKKEVSCPKVKVLSTTTTRDNRIGEAKGESSSSALLEEHEGEASSTEEGKKAEEHTNNTEEDDDPANTLGWPKEIWDLYGKQLGQNNGNDGSLDDDEGEGHAPRESAKHGGSSGGKGFSEEVLSRVMAPPASAFLSSTNGRGFPCGASKDADYFTQLLRMTGLEQTYVSAASYVEACEAVTMGPDAAITHDFASLARHISSQLLGGGGGGSAGGGLAAVAEMDMETLLFDRVPQQKAAIVEAAAGLGSGVDESFARANNETRDDLGEIEEKEGAILAAAAAAKTLTTQFLGISYSVHEPYTSTAEDLLPKRVFSEDETWQAVSELGQLLSSSQTNGNRHEVKKHGNNGSDTKCENNMKDADALEEKEEALEEEEDRFADATPSYQRMIDRYHTLSASQKEASLALVRSWELSSVEIVFDNVSFSYPDYPYDYVLKNISFVIPRGAFVGVVGKSGCGKSTLLALLIGLYAPTEGRILFNGVEVVGDGKMRASAAQTSARSNFAISESDSLLSPSPRGAISSSSSTLMSPHQNGPVSSLFSSSRCTARTISALPMRALRRRIAYVGSLCDFFPATISANIVLGDAVTMLALRPKSGGHGEQLEDPTIRDERICRSIQRALVDAQADAFVAASAGGLETRLGKLFYSAYDEAGGGMGSGGPFSGGELQRLMIARAFAKDPQHTLLYVMDEATCSLDAETERLVQERFVKVKANTSASAERGEKLSAPNAETKEVPLEQKEEGRYGPRTCVVAAHRLATLKPASHILVLDEGRLVQQGSWEELAGDESGLFATFIAAQKLHLYDEYETTRTAHHSPPLSNQL